MAVILVIGEDSEDTVGGITDAQSSKSSTVDPVDETLCVSKVSDPPAKKKESKSGG